MSARQPPASRPPLAGAILAGGQNRRYGAPKALATVAGERIIDRVRRALIEVTPELFLIANDAATYAPVGMPMRPDARPGLGALGGIYSALRWAEDEGRPGVLAVACDMPFLSPALLYRLADSANDADVVAPESGGRRGVEPLCAYYGVRCIAAIEAELARGERRVIGFYDDVVVQRIPLADVRAFGEPEVLFLNVNTPEERERAERIAAERPGTGGARDHDARLHRTASRPGTSAEGGQRPGAATGQSVPDGGGDGVPPRHPGDRTP